MDIQLFIRKANITGRNSLKDRKKPTPSLSNIRGGFISARCYRVSAASASGVGPDSLREKAADHVNLANGSKHKF
jgi:hypothetical protein